MEWNFHRRPEGRPGHSSSRLAIRPVAAPPTPGRLPDWKK